MFQQEESVTQNSWTSVSMQGTSARSVFPAFLDLIGMMIECARIKLWHLVTSKLLVHKAGVQVKENPTIRVYPPLLSSIPQDYGRKRG